MYLYVHSGTSAFISYYLPRYPSFLKNAFYEGLEQNLGVRKMLTYFKVRSAFSSLNSYYSPHSSRFSVLVLLPLFLIIYRVIQVF